MLVQPREEYVEQAHFFRGIGERLGENIPLQELLGQVKFELLSTTRLPLAIDFLLAELKHLGTISTAMQRLGHYFTPFQTYLVREAENDRGRFDFRIAIEILHREAAYRSTGEASPQGIFLFQFECLCRNRLRYDPGLGAVAEDPIFNADWKEWILTVRHQMGLVDFAELLFVRSEYYRTYKTRPGEEPPQIDQPLLFGEQEGKIAFANRRKDPLFLFAALQRHLGYPAVPRPKKVEEGALTIPLLVQTIQRLEARVKLLEDEERGGIDITKFYGPASRELKNIPPPDDL